MTEAGMVRVSAAISGGQWDEAAEREDPACVPAELTRALAANSRARCNFEKLAPSYRKQFIYWIAAARREETRRKRVEEAIRLLVRDQRLGMK